VATIGRRVQALRIERGLTQEALAAKTKLSRGYLARLETDRHDPTLSTVRRLAKVLRVTVGQLVD
jgi:transcriptional regulator with XRE-family HTH domain